jgi:hypothetical protein
MVNSSHIVNDAIDRIELALEAGRDTPAWAFVMIAILCMILSMCAAHMMVLCLVTPTICAWSKARSFSRVLEPPSLEEEQEPPRPKRKKKSLERDDAFDMES